MLSSGLLQHGAALRWSGWGTVLYESDLTVGNHARYALAPKEADIDHVMSSTLPHLPIVHHQIDRLRSLEHRALNLLYPHLLSRTGSERSPAWQERDCRAN